MSESLTKPFSGIFVSYRREDSSDSAGRLVENLLNHFGQDQIFMDLEQIEPGEDFVTVIENAVGSCGILIAVIGRYWLSTPNDGSRRLDNPNDFVRLEIGAALKREILVIPVLVQGATMPGPQDLPEDLSRLSRRQALELSNRRWKHDVDQLIRVLKKELEARIRAEEDAQRQAEEERRACAAEESRRLAEDARRVALQEAEERYHAEEARLLLEQESLLQAAVELRRSKEFQRKAEEAQSFLNAQEGANAREESRRRIQVNDHPILRPRANDIVYGKTQQRMAGIWALQIETPFGRDIPARLIITEDTNKLTGKIESEMGDGDLTSTTVVGDSFFGTISFNVAGHKMGAQITGKVANEQMNGNLTLENTPLYLSPVFDNSHALLH